jgi:hypothetical protein
MARESVIIPEVIEPDEKLPRDLVALRKFAVLMDEAVRIPGTKRRIGVDAGIGFIPGIGPFIGGLLSLWIIVGALRHRVPMFHVSRMVINVLIDMVVGEVPILGDVFDLLFEENVINFKMLLRYRDRTQPPRSFGAIAGAALVVTLIILAVGVGLLALTIAAVFWLIAQR